MNLLLIVIALALSAGASPPDSDAESPPPEPVLSDEDEDASSLLERLAEAAADVEHLQARFRQVRHTPLLREPIESTGTIQIGPKLVVWKTDEPTRSVMSVEEGEVRLYYPDEQLLEIYSLGEHVSAAVATPLLRTDRLRKQYEVSVVPPGDEASDLTNADRVSPGCVRLRLTPRAEDLRIRVASIRIDVDMATGFVRRGEMRGADGERTVLYFNDIEVNPEGAPEDPTRSVPRDTTVSRPGDGAQTGAADNDAPPGDGQP